uniref:Ig-like domain-containing protein n=1 Tax=Kryptolebias marmoratus TaxID=37003 RepID=A0A3Q3A354_KRYMA
MYFCYSKSKTSVPSGTFPFSSWRIIITAVTGQTITLPCGAPENRTVIVVEWSRTDLGSDYVLRYRDEQFQTELQHPSFKDRVDLQDRQMKDGDVSLVLKNVTINDTGTYECRVVQRGERERKLIRIIYLEVSPPGELCQSSSSVFTGMEKSFRHLSPQM